LESYVDGNEMAGALRELFAVDVTDARSRCANCGREGAVAQAQVYDRAPGLVARCPGCDAVLMRLVRSPDRAWLDLRGVSYLQFQLP
jgi:hypothetical protein